jgi:Berberine and berberine like
LTFFGLDAYFKAYSFTLLFSKNKKKAVFYDFLALIPKSSEPTVHFIVEASWRHSTRSNSSNAKLNKSPQSNNNDPIFQKLKSLHSKLAMNPRNGSKIDTCRDWLSTDRPWSVPSYDLVWGAGHSYGGSSIIIDKQFEDITVKQSLESFKLHVDKNTGKCSDCVIVFHRIGEKLQNRIATKSSPSSSALIHDEFDTNGQGQHERDLSTESFNPFRKNGSLWVEMDCGHFYPQKDTWPNCSGFIDETQRAFDRIVPKGHKSHYPNVPNLVTEDWREQYYGEEGYRRLQEIKQIWDPENVFRHSQSVSAVVEKSAGDIHSTTSVNNVTAGRRASGGVNMILNRLKDSSLPDRFKNYETDSALLSHCVAMYDRSAMSDFRNRFDVTRIYSKLAEKFRSVVQSWNSR